MPTKPKEKVRLAIVIEHAGFPRSLYFNRYELEPFDDKNVLAHFGLVVGSTLAGRYSCVLTKRVIDQHREETLSKDVTQASPIALLRCSLGLQKKFIEDLFAQ